MLSFFSKSSIETSGIHSAQDKCTQAFSVNSFFEVVLIYSNCDLTGVDELSFAFSSFFYSLCFSFAFLFFYLQWQSYCLNLYY